jgi:WD40 repeat protein/tRNA A-37 threonylcarbamoyl transferase component Bud32
MPTYACPGCRQLLQVAAFTSQPCRCPRCGHVSVAVPEAFPVTETGEPSLPEASDGSLTQGGSPSAAAEADATFAVSPPATPVGARSETATQARLPAVPGYEVIEELGRGAMGVVYKARQRGLNRMVALKLIRTGAHASAQQRARFQAEVAALARLQHPGIVQIHEVGEFHGLPFFAMDYLAGGPLHRKLRGQPLPPREAARLAASLARAVQHAHEAGVLHRDLKPSNILLDGGGGVRVVDFGLAKHLNAVQGPTCTGTVIGTPSYMAPEQAHGHNRKLGPAADVYSLGAILYELLTGRPPFKAANPTETILQVVSDEPVAPSRLTARLPPALEVICLKCLAKSPARRYPSARALADDLERYLRGEPIQARPVSAPVRALLWARRRPAAAAVLALAGVMGLAVVVGLFWFARYQQGQRREADELGRRAEQAARDAADASAEAKRKAEQEIEARGQAEVQLQAAQKARRQAQRESAELALERGRDLCEQGDVRLGVVWMARSLMVAADEDLQRIGRLNLAGWLQGHTPTLRACLEPATLPLSRSSIVGLLGSPLAPAPLLTATSLLPGRLDPNSSYRAGAFSPDGRRVAVGHGPALTVHDTATGRRLLFARLKSDVSSIAWGRDGRLLAVGTGKGRHDNWYEAGPGAAQVLDAGSGQSRAGPLTHPHTVRSLALSPDGKVLLTGCQDGHARLWDVETGRLRKQVKCPGPAAGVGFSGDGKQFLTAATRTGADRRQKGEVQFWDTATAEPIPNRSFNTTIVNAAEVRNDGRSVAISGHSLEIWNTDPASPDFGKQVEKGTGWAEWSVAHGGDSSLIATCGSSWRARVYRMAGGQQVGQTLLLNGWAFVVALSPDGGTLLTGDVNDAKLWDLQPPRPPQAELQVERAHMLTFSPDRTRLAATLDNNRVQLFDARTGQAVGLALQHPTGIPRLALTPDNRTVVTACYDRQVRVWDAESGKLAHAKPWAHAAEVDVGALSADGKLAVSGCRDGKAQVWDVKTGKAVGPALDGAGEITAAAFSPDGRTVVLGDQSFQVRGWEVGTGKPRGEPVRLTGRPTALAVSRDNRRVLVGTTGDNVARLLDIQAGRPVGPLLLHKDAVLEVAFSPDETLLATGSSWKDKTARLWDTASGKAIGPPVRHHGQIPAVAFSADGTALWTASTDRRVIRTELPAAAPGSPPRVYTETALRAGMFLRPGTDVEGVVNYANWVQLRQRLAEPDSEKQR